VTGVATGSARESPYPRSVGVLGSGFLTLPLTRRLVDTLPAGTQLSVFGRKPDVLVRQQAMGAARAASPADLAARCEVVFFLLGEVDQIESQLVGPSGFEAGVHSPTIAVITTALAPEGLRSLAHRVADRTAGRLRLVDAPLSGPRSAVLRGELSIAVGVASSAYPGIEPLLSLLGPCLRVGGIGSAQVAHACEQLMVAAAAVGLGEAILVAERSGLDVDALLANWRRSDPAGRLLDAALEQRASREAEREQPASLMSGALEVGAGEAERIGVPARVLAQLRGIGERLAEAGLGHQDLSTGYRALVAALARPGSSPDAPPASGTGAA
jgi:3-hydroxyisobutyrate dehydrogenase-like beta-hydroxyacid dehydrogenase